jgi:hypothetical protein
MVANWGIIVCPHLLKSSPANAIIGQNESMDSLSLHPLDKDWYGAKSPGCPQWGLEIIDGLLVLNGKVCAPPICIGGDSEGHFVEGLWEADVVELFLLNPATGFYLEFNLGPRGGWWCCSFSLPRARVDENPKPLPGVRAVANLTEAGWGSSLAVPLHSLPQCLSFDLGKTRGNITFCLGAPQQYITLADLGGGEPDFHRPEKWLPITSLLAPHP